LLPAVSVKQFLDLFIAFSAIFADAKAIEYLFARANAIINRAFNLGICDCFANTYVHGNLR
jgi:hypothetical protein